MSGGSHLPIIPASEDLAFLWLLEARTLIYDEINQKYLCQFPITPNNGILPFFKLRNLKGEVFFDYNIEEINYKSDILYLNKKTAINYKNFKLAKEKVKIGQNVYLIGYPGFLNFETTSISIIETKVIGTSSFLGREFIVTKDSPQHGMSGGPVLNEKREVVGIVYAGADLENDYNSDKVGFISLV